MKTKLLILTAYLFACFFANAQYTSIPDANFEQALINQNIDSEGILDGQILTADAEATTNFTDLHNPFQEPNSTRINNLIGIEAFTALVILRVKGHRLASVDLSSNLELKNLQLDDNRLTSLDLTNNTLIEYLSVTNNELTSINTSSCINLIEFYCSNNQLSSLYVNNLPNLINFSVASNLLFNLDLSDNTLLDYVVLTNNPNLDCIQIDSFSSVNSSNWFKDSQASYSENCGFQLITTWQTFTNNSSITIPTANSGNYNYQVSWGDGEFSTHLTTNASHEYINAGVYTVTITGDFPQIYFNNSGSKDNILSVEQWGTNPWASMQGAFHGCTNLVINASDSPVLSNVTDMSRMFAFCSSLNQDISDWDVSTVTNMASTFLNTSVFNQDIGSWNVSNVTNMSSMFWNSNNFNQDISAWNVGNVTNMGSMFRSADAFNQNISSWDVSAVTNMATMFASAFSFDQNLGNWDISSVSNMTSMFFNVSLSVSNYDSTLIGWSTLGTSETQIPENITFSGGNSKYCAGESARTNLINTPYDWTITDGGIDCSGAFITTWETTTANQTITIPTTETGYNYHIDWDNDGIFDDLGVTGDVVHTYSVAGTHTVTITGDFPRIYFNNTGDRQNILSVEQWGNNPWSSMRSAFHGCSNLIINATDNPDLSNVSDMSFMFTFCSSFNEDISTWDVSNVTNMAHTFRNTAAYNQDIGGWDVSNVTTMTSMFWNANVFNQDISAWNVSNVNDMSLMFRSADNFNQDIGAWDVSNVTAMNLMFAGALSFDQNLGNWDISSVSNMNTMFFANSLSVPNYDATLTGWSTLDSGETQIPENITFSGGNSKYCEGESARTILMNTPYDWTITDGGLDCATLGTNEEIFQGLNIFPNPVKSDVTISLQEKTSYILLDINGRQIKKGELMQGETVLNLSSLSKGLYLLKLSYQNQSIIKKIIKE